MALCVEAVSVLGHVEQPKGSWTNLTKAVRSNGYLKSNGHKHKAVKWGEGSGKERREMRDS